MFLCSTMSIPTSFWINNGIRGIGQILSSQLSPTVTSESAPDDSVAWKHHRSPGLIWRLRSFSGIALLSAPCRANERVSSPPTIVVPAMSNSITLWLLTAASATVPSTCVGLTIRVMITVLDASDVIIRKSGKTRMLFRVLAK